MAVDSIVYVAVIEKDNIIGLFSLAYARVVKSLACVDKIKAIIMIRQYYKPPIKEAALIVESFVNNRDI